MNKKLIKKIIIHFLGIVMVWILGMSIYLQFFWVPENVFENFKHPIILIPIFLWFIFTYLTYLFWDKKKVWKLIFILNIIFWTIYLIYTFPKIDFNFQIFFTAYFSINLLFLANTFNALEEYKNKHE
jgi:hypothetical protein